MSKAGKFEAIVGTYEEFLLGYNYTKKGAALVQSFTAHDHAASVRCVAASDHYIASGGADDRIFVYDLKARKEHCSLTHHNATITCLQFTKNHSHLISGSSDGVLAIVRVGNWQLEKLWEKAHKGSAILDIAVHSSGKLALTLGADFTLCTWNLVKGRQAYVINLNSKCKQPRSQEKVLWAPDGVRFVLYGGSYTEIWSIETGHILKQVQHMEKVTNCVWHGDDKLLVGHEDGHISVVYSKGKPVKIFKAHNNRVKGITTYKKQIVSICSGGYIKVWNDDLEEIAAVDTGCRLTCICVVPGLHVKKEILDESDTIQQVEDESLTVKEAEISKQCNEDDTNGGTKKRAKLTENDEKTEIKTKGKKKTKDKKYNVD